MNARQRLCLHQGGDGGPTVVLELHKTAIIEELADGDHIGPDAEILLGDQWVDLRDHPAAPWRDRMAERAIEAAERDDPVGVEHYASKVLRFSRDCEAADRHEAVRAAKFLLGHLTLCAGRPRDAVVLLESAAGIRSRFAEAARNNLGVAWALAHHPEAALASLRAASDGSGFPVANLSLRNLARTLAAEGAPALRDQPPWSEIARREDARLREPSAAARIHAFLRARGAFPDYRFWHVFRESIYMPEIGSELVVEPIGRCAAAWLLAEGNRAWNDGDDARVQLLADAAIRFDHAVRPMAGRLAGTAMARREEQRALERARRCTHWLGVFLRQLCELNLDDLDAPREALAAMSKFVDMSLLERLHRERIEDLAAEAVQGEPTEPGHRARLWTLSHRYASPEDAAPYLAAALRCLSAAALRDYWGAAIGRGDLHGAIHSLTQAESVLGPADDLPNKRALLEGLQSHRATNTMDQTA
jgi:hypothetical protein